jgi:hypothetical protein
VGVKVHGDRDPRIRQALGHDLEINSLKQEQTRVSKVQVIEAALLRPMCTNDLPETRDTVPSLSELASAGGHIVETARMILPRDSRRSTKRLTARVGSETTRDLSDLMGSNSTLPASRSRLRLAEINDLSESMSGHLSARISERLNPVSRVVGNIFWYGNGVLTVTKVGAS